jgi:hypothetical protein
VASAKKLWQGNLLAQSLLFIEQKSNRNDVASHPDEYQVYCSKTGPFIRCTLFPSSEPYYWKQMIRSNGQQEIHSKIRFHRLTNLAADTSLLKTQRFSEQYTAGLSPHYDHLISATMPNAALPIDPDPSERSIKGNLLSSSVLARHNSGQNRPVRSEVSGASIMAAYKG